MGMNAPGSRIGACALAARAAAAGSAAAFPGMAACRVPARWMIQG
jgi:hypothetical protein